MVLEPKQTLWLILCLIFAAKGQADTTLHQRTVTTDQYRVSYWTSEQGLPQNTVACLLQARNGYLWIGTRYGLARYDGVKFTDYSAELSEYGDDGLDVRGFAEDSQGRLWLNTRGGLVSYSEGRFRPHSLGEAPFSGKIQCICACRMGGIWVAQQDGLFRFEDGRIERCLGLGKEIPRRLGAADETVDGLLEDPQGHLWVRVASPDACEWQRLEATTATSESVGEVLGQSLKNIGGLCPGRLGRLWLAGPEELLCWENGRLARFSAARAWAGCPVKEVVEDARGNVWIATGGPNQLHRFADGRFTNYGRREGLRDAEDVRCLLPDLEGNLWVGTGGGGLSRVQPRQLVSLLTGSESALDEVYSLALGGEGRVWLATTYGLVKFQAGQFTVYTNSAALEPANMKRVRTVYERSSGQVFFGLDFDGLHTLQNGRFLPVQEAALSGPERRMVTSLYEDASGTLWVASQKGLAEQRGSTWRLWTTTNGLSDNRTFGITGAPDGSLWVGTQSGGVNQFKAGRFRAYSIGDGLLSQNAWPLRAEADGSVWVGTPLGLNRIRGGEVRSVTMRDGLFDNLAYCLLEDGRGNYWTFGNRGIWRVKKGELQAVADGRAKRAHCVSYGEADGMASSEGNGDEQPNATRLPNGELWFPTTRGVVVLDPERLGENSVRPQVVIEEVRVDEELVYRDGGNHSADNFCQLRDGRLGMPAGRARVLEVRYTANTFIDSEKTRFRFRLEGEETEWREADTSRVAVYTNLRPGSYRFSVQACNHHGYWSERTAEFAFVLAPHFYQTWPFYGCCGLMSAAGLVGWHFRRLNTRLGLLKLKQAQALEAERNRIAKDLHDDLGANLTGIALKIEVARGELDRPGVLQERLQNVAESIRRHVDQMREVVWSLNPQCDTLESFCAYICDYAESFLADAGLNCRLDFPEEIPPRLLAAEARHELLLVVKEALNNAAKHAVATEVRLSLSLAKGDLTLAIADNGHGFAASLPMATPTRAGSSGRFDRGPVAGSTGNGLRNMRRRMEALGGSFELSSELGLGTRIVIHLPLPRVQEL